MMDWNAVKAAVDLASLFFAMGAFIYAWRVKRSQASQDQIDAVRNDVSTLRLQVTAAEIKSEDAPTQQSIHELALAIEHLSGEFKAMGARMDGLDGVIRRLETMTNRQEDFLLKAGGA